MISSDTIIAPATAVGEGGIAVVRISGPRAQDALQHYFQPTARPCRYRPRQLYHGYLTDSNGSHLDEIMAVYMPAPHTYTCDDVVEIHCHGSQQVVKAILQLYLDFGLRLAQPGEFTYRAFINGRLDLSQAEAVAQLIHSKTDSARQLALSQVEGVLSQTLYRITDELRQVQVLMEAWIDFPEEELPTEDLARMTTTITHQIDKIQEITDTYNSGRMLTEGASILLVGRPNVGKSSLLNALLGEDRAIVTDIPGTTRDLLEEGLTIAGVPVRLVDTAGLRDSIDPVELEGVRRAKAKIAQADLILYLVDGSRAVVEEDRFAYQAIEGGAAFLVRTKLDLDQQADTSYCRLPRYQVSIKTGVGLEELRTAIGDFLLGEHLPGHESVLLTEQRHYDALIACRKHLETLLQGLQDQQPLEFLALDIREALYQLGQISGATTTDDILQGIFSQFCIGK